MASQGGNSNFDFNAGAGIDFTGFGMQPTAYNDLKGTGEGNTSPAFFFGDEGIDTTATFDHSFDSMFASVDPLSSTAFGMEPLGLDNTNGNASWDVNSTFPMTPAQSFDSLYTPQLMSKRSLQLDVGDFPPAKRHEAFSPFSTTSASLTAGSSNWALDTQSTPTVTSESVGLSDEAADVCATWFSKYNVLPSDRHIDSLSQLTGESASAIRQWFGQALKQGMTGQDSAYKSQTSFAQDPILFPPITHATSSVTSQQLAINDSPCNHDTTQALTTLSQSPLRGGKKGCNPTEDPELLKRDPNKIYQCTRKCGKRYGRKCDWKRNEEEGYPSKSWMCSLCISEGVERVKPCFRKYHFSQHFRNIHPGLNSADYEETSIVHSDTSLPSHARKCGFCTHRFVSRQDRIDHIAEHFKNGKCMLDWNEDDDQHDSDDMNDDDDNDDRPDSGGFGNGKPSFPPNSHPRGSSSGPKGNGGGGQQPPQSGFYQFQVSQFADGDSRGTSPGVDKQADQDLGTSQFIRSIDVSDVATCSKLSPIISGNTDQSLSQCSMHGRQEEAARDDSQTLAGNAVSMNTDIVQLQTISPYVPPGEGDPTISDRHKTFAARSSAALTRESQDLLGSLKLLGAGGFSTVDEVVHRETSLRFARKTLKNRERSALDELKNEVEVLQKLRHPHIIRFVGSVQKDNKMSILLSPVAETTLATWLDTKLHDRPDGLSQTIVNMLGCLASSIRYLHEQRPVVKHMDIKPQNILVKEGEKFPHVILSDFGISSIGELTANDKVMPLTRQYCAPEVSEGISRELASDIWSLGCVFLEMLTVAFKDNNSVWQKFPQVFGGRNGKYYWQDVPTLQNLLGQSLQQAATQSEANATRAVKDMLNSDPVQRPTAPTLTMVFTPAPCCLSWPNAKATYPGPNEELETAKALLREGGIDGCTSLHVATAQQKQTDQSVLHAKRWLEECEHEHEACRHDLPDIQANKTLPTRLIDILPDGKVDVSVRIVNSADLYGPKPDYATISHVWSDDELKISSGSLESMQTGLARESLPIGIKEAIAKAHDIGFRYVWVDSLCVLQDSDADKERECRAMADTYRNAALTIVLDQFKSQSAGLEKIHSCVSDTTAESSEQQRSLLAATLPLAVYMAPGFAWETRAWSLQERLLSRRLLHLGEEQMYWECNALKASETFPRGYEAWDHAFSSLLWEKVHTKPSIIDSTQNQHNRKLDNQVPAVAETAVQMCKCDVDGRGAPCASKAKGYGKMATPHHEGDLTPRMMKDCQFIRNGRDDTSGSKPVAGQMIDSGLLESSLRLQCPDANNQDAVSMRRGLADENANGSTDEGICRKNANGNEEDMI